MKIVRKIFKKADRIRSSHSNTQESASSQDNQESIFNYDNLTNKIDKFFLTTEKFSKDKANEHTVTDGTYQACIITEKKSEKGLKNNTGINLNEVIKVKEVENGLKATEFIMFSKITDNDNLSKKSIASDKGGYKLRVTVADEGDNYKKAWDLLYPLIIKHDIPPTKFVRDSQRHVAQNHGTQYGKLITIYAYKADNNPNWEQFMKDVTQTFQEKNIKPGPLSNVGDKADTSVIESSYFAYRNDSKNKNLDNPWEGINLGDKQERPENPHLQNDENNAQLVITDNNISQPPMSRESMGIAASGVITNPTPTVQTGIPTPITPSGR